MTFAFSGRRALILGGSCELAMNLSRRLIEESLYPIITYRNEKGLCKIQETLVSFSGKYEIHQLVFGDSGLLDTLFRNIGEDLDFLVDFVQGDYESLIASADEDAVRRYFADNVAFRSEILKRTARVMMKKRRGRLIYISSTAAERPNRGQGFYSASKLASEALYRNAGLELGKRGVTAAILRPGYIDSGRGAVYLKKQDMEPIKKVPIGRAVTGEEIAQTILYLLSDGAESINGTVITMDGGLTIGK